MDCFKNHDFVNDGFKNQGFENDGFENQWFLKEGFEVEIFLFLATPLPTTYRGWQTCGYFNTFSNKSQEKKRPKSTCFGRPSYASCHCSISHFLSLSK